LFWALWTPNFPRGNVSKEELEGLRGMARSMYDDRLAAMYVSPDPSERGELLQNVSEERARTMIGLNAAVFVDRRAPARTRCDRTEYHSYEAGRLD
jgi:hypothetical protein